MTPRILAAILLSGAVTVNPTDENAGVVTADMVVDNGVTHGIDAVLIP